MNPSLHRSSRLTPALLAALALGNCANAELVNLAPAWQDNNAAAGLSSQSSTGFSLDMSPLDSNGNNSVFQRAGNFADPAFGIGSTLTLSFDVQPTNIGAALSDDRAFRFSIASEDGHGISGRLDWGAPDGETMQLAGSTSIGGSQIGSSTFRTTQGTDIPTKSFNQTTDPVTVKIVATRTAASSVDATLFFDDASVSRTLTTTGYDFSSIGIFGIRMATNGGGVGTDTNAFTVSNLSIDVSAPTAATIPFIDDWGSDGDTSAGISGSTASGFSLDLNAVGAVPSSNNRVFQGDGDFGSTALPVGSTLTMDFDVKPDLITPVAEDLGLRFSVVAANGLGVSARVDWGDPDGVVFGLGYDTGITGGYIGKYKTASAVTSTVAPSTSLNQTTTPVSMSLVLTRTATDTFDATLTFDDVSVSGTFTDPGFVFSSVDLIGFRSRTNVDAFTVSNLSVTIATPSLGSIAIDSVTPGSPDNTVRLIVRVPAGNVIETDFFLNSSSDLSAFTSLDPADYSVFTTVNDGDEDVITIDTDTSAARSFYHISAAPLP